MCRYSRYKRVAQPFASGAGFVYQRSLPALALVVWLVASGAAAAQEPQLFTAEELVALRELGFTETDLMTELRPAQGKLALSEQDLNALRQSGFSDSFIDFARSLAPVRIIDNAAIVEYLQAGMPAAEIIDTIAAAQPRFDTSPKALLALGKHVKLAPAVVQAMRGEALTVERLKAVLDSGAQDSEIAALVAYLGMADALSAADALALIRAGLSQPLVARIREAAATGGKQDAAQESADDAAALELRSFRHVLDLFELSYPAGWFFRRQVLNGDIAYFATPDPTLDDTGRLVTGIGVFMFPLADQPDPTASGMIAKFAAVASQLSGDLELVGEAEAFQEPQRNDVVFQRYRTRIDDTPVSGQVYAFTGETFAYLLFATAPTTEFDAFAAVARQVAGRFALPRAERADASATLNLTRQDVIQRYDEAIVMIKAYGDDPDTFATGTGFFVREDGYLLTNAHVVLNPKHQKPFKRFEVVWPERFGRKPEQAELIDFRFSTQSVGEFAVDEDVALLKVSLPKTLPVLPLTTLDNVVLGDEIVVIGYPISKFFDAQSKPSTTVTGGVVTRYVQDENGRVTTIISDAKVASGNSGGPAISLRTGGVIGLATQASTKILGDLVKRNLADASGYSGILPSSRVIEVYPQETQVSAARDLRMNADDAYDLALRSFQNRHLEGALKVVERAIQRQPQNADVYALRGHIERALTTLPEHRKKARKSYEKALEINPRHAPTLIARAESELADGELLAALRYADKAVDAAGQLWATRYTRAQVNIALERYDAALDDLGAAQRFSGALIPQPFTLAGFARFLKGDYEAGLELFKKAVALAPKDVHARLGIGEYYFNKQDYYSALIEYDRLNAEVTEQPEVHWAIGNAYRQLADNEKALDYYWQGLTFHREQNNFGPAPLAVYEAVVEVARKMRDTRKANWAYTRIMDSYPKADAGVLVEGHEYLAEQAKEKHAAVARAHLRFAQELAKEEDPALLTRVREQLDKVANANLRVDDLTHMRDSQYFPPLTAALVGRDDVTLGFALRGKTDRKTGADDDRFKHFLELREAYGAAVAEAVYWKAVAQERAGNRTQQDRQPETLSVVGRWRYQGNKAAVELELNDGQTFRSFIVRDGGRALHDEGRWAVEQQGTTLVLQSPKNGRQSIPVRLQQSEDKKSWSLVLTINGRQRHYEPLHRQ